MVRRDEGWRRYGQGRRMGPCWGGVSVGTDRAGQGRAVALVRLDGNGSVGR